MQSTQTKDAERVFKLLTLAIDYARETGGEEVVDAYIAKLVVAWVRKHLDNFTVGHVFLAEMGVDSEIDD